MRLVFQEGEKVLYKDAPSKRILFMWFFTSILITIFLSFIFSWVFVLFLAGALTGSGASGIMYGYSVFFIVILILVFLYHVALRKTYKYYITSERIIFEGGIILKRIKSVPYHKVTDVSISQNIIERVVGISKANVHTAGTGMHRPEIQFVGLTEPEKSQSIVVNRLRGFQSNRQASTYSE